MNIASNIPLELAVFLAMPPDKQVKYLYARIPAARGISNNPLRALINAIQTYLPYYYDFYPISATEGSADALRLAIEKVAVGRDSWEDFSKGSEWAELRGLARNMLSAAGNVSCAVTLPLPLRDWVDHFDWPTDCDPM
jgi:hypothetical protein